MTLLFRPMLAYSKTPKLSEITYPCIASPKLDGIRCIMADGIAFTRSMKRVPNLFIQRELAKLQLHGLDGELMVNGGFDKVQSAVMSVYGAPDFYLNVFDTFDHAGGFTARNAQAARVVFSKSSPLLKFVEQVVCDDETQLQYYWDLWVSQGYEGGMVRALDGPYKRGRSTLKQGYLLKLKKWEDVEAIILGCEEGETNANEAFVGELGQTKRSHESGGMVPSGTLGALRVEWQGKVFKVGSGFGQGIPGRDAMVRADLWNREEEIVGKKVTIKYQELTHLGIPRFPVYKGIREDE